MKVVRSALPTDRLYPPEIISGTHFCCGPGSSVGLAATGRSGDQIPVGARFFAHVQTGPRAHPASCTLGTGSFPGVKQPASNIRNRTLDLTACSTVPQPTAYPTSTNNPYLFMVSKVKRRPWNQKVHFETVVTLPSPYY
jgi:hypothetical protein